MLQTLFVYLSLLYIMVYYANLANKSYITGRSNIKSNISFLCLLSIFAIVFGMRYYVGIDYPSYLTVYENPNNYGVERYEPAFYFLTTLFQSYNLHFTIYFGVISFLQVFFFYYAFRKHRYIWPFLTITLILSDIAILGWTNVVRHWIAINIFITSLSFLVQQNKKSIVLFYIWISLAICFHKSAWIVALVPLYVLFKNYIFNKSKILIILLIIFFVLQYLNAKQYLFVYIEPIISLLDYESYISSSMYSSVKSLGIFDFLTLAIYLLIARDSDKIKLYYKGDNLFRIIYDFAFLGILLNYIFSGSMMLTRTVMYFSVIQYPLFAFVMAYYYKKKNINHFIFIVYFILSFLRIMLSMNSNTARYVFYFQDELHPVKIQERFSGVRIIN